MSNWNETAKDLADKHVDWFLEAVRPLLVEHFIHGYKHGMDRLGISEQATKRDAENLVGCEVCGRLDGSHHSDCKYYNPRE